MAYPLITAIAHYGTPLDQIGPIGKIAVMLRQRIYFHWLIDCHLAHRPHWRVHEIEARKHVFVIAMKGSEKNIPAVSPPPTQFKDATVGHLE